jgi:hypothetical protein
MAQVMSATAQVLGEDAGIAALDVSLAPLTFKKYDQNEEFPFLMVFN